MAGRKLFSLALETTPDLAKRIAIGAPGVEETNVTLIDVLIEFSKVYNELSYLQKQLNLSDILDVASARTNLDVYSKSEVFTKSETTAAIAAVENKFGGMRLAASVFINASPDVGDGNSVSGCYVISSDGLFALGTVTKESNGIYKIVHNISGTNYMVMGVCDFGGGDDEAIFANVTMQSGYIRCGIRDASSGLYVNSDFRIMIWRY